MYVCCVCVCVACIVCMMCEIKSACGCRDNPLDTDKCTTIGFAYYQIPTTTTTTTTTTGAEN